MILTSRDGWLLVGKEEGIQWTIIYSLRWNILQEREDEEERIQERPVIVPFFIAFFLSLFFKTNEEQENVLKQNE